MFRRLPQVALLLGAATLAGQASAHGHDAGPAVIGAVVGAVVGGAIVASRPAPVYVQPAPVYVAPPPVVYAPPPPPPAVYYYPAQPVYYPPVVAQPVYYGPGPYYGPPRHWHGGGPRRW